MLSDSTLIFMGFINLFMIPLISLKIYYQRHSIPYVFHANMIFLYALMNIINILMTRILVNIAEAILSTVIYVETTKYTFIALVSSVLLPFVVEAIETFIHVNVQISVTKLKNKKSSSEETDEN